jgi:hypothetical protein
MSADTTTLPTVLPSGYSIDNRGLWWQRKHRVSDPFTILGASENRDGIITGIVIARLVKFPQPITIPRAMLHRPALRLTEFLEERGLRVDCDELSKNLLQGFLQRLNLATIYRR